jgi:DNA invertase Pin-like site-specific DNA recombinase
MKSELRAIGYIRVSTEDQASSGAGLDAQRAAITFEASRRLWTLLEIAEDAGSSGKSLKGRPGLAAALKRLEAGEADALLVSKLDRLTRSLLDFSGLMERARKQGWAIVAMDIGVDMTTPAGELVANVMASVAEWERKAIGARTREALAAKRAAGVRLGRRPTMPDDVRLRITRERLQGKSLAKIADALNADGIATAQGGARWHGSTVAKALAAKGTTRESV